MVLDNARVSRRDPEKDTEMETGIGEIEHTLSENVNILEDLDLEYPAKFTCFGVERPPAHSNNYETLEHRLGHWERK
ncbi:MAG: hypothetical protein M1834_009119 [Cirrosporium novae-zelandiae]|nr:MAG: hypothetical protein M1834_009119 [Cirrosporium novae-zelandiae]